MAITPIQSWIRPQDESITLVAGSTFLVTPSDLLGDDVGLNGSVLALKSVAQPDHGQLSLQADGNYLYTPEPGYVGPMSFSYTVTDQFGNVCTEHIRASITSAAPNIAPTVTDEFVSVTAGMAVSAHESVLLSNDQDTDGGILSVANYSKPAHGTLSRAADGTLTYVADASYSGTDSFTYEVSDGQGGVAVGTVHFNVLAAENQAPNVQGEFASLRSGTSVSAPESVLLANDTDPEGSALTLKSLGQPANGTLVRAADGTLTYTPKAGFVGADSFSYVVADAQGKESTATVTLEVTAPVVTPAFSGIQDNSGDKQGQVSSGGATDDRTPTFKGTAEPGALVELYDGQTKIGETHAGADGAWQLTPSSPLTSGAHSLSVRTTAPDGAVADSAPFAVTIAADAPGLTLLTDTNGDGSISKAELDAAGGLDVKVALGSDAKAGDHLVLVDQDGHRIDHALTADDIAAKAVILDNVFSTPNNGQAFAVSVTLHDAAGNVSLTSSVNAKVSTTPPVPAMVQLTLADDLNNDTTLSRPELRDHTGLSVRVALLAGMSEGDVVAVRDNAGHSVSHTVTAADIGYRSFDLFDAFPIPASGGAITVTATVTHVSGIVSTPVSDMLAFEGGPTPCGNNDSATVEGFGADVPVASILAADENLVYGVLSGKLAAGMQVVLHYGNYQTQGIISADGLHWTAVPWNVPSNTPWALTPKVEGVGGHADTVLSTGASIPLPAYSAISRTESLVYNSQAELETALATGSKTNLGGAPVLQLAGDGMYLDLTQHDATPGKVHDLNNIYHYDLVAGSGRNSLVMSINDVLTQGVEGAILNDHKVQVVVDGDANDSLSLKHLLNNGGDSGNWVAAGTCTFNGIAYNIYNHSTLQRGEVLVQQGVRVDLPTDPGKVAQPIAYNQVTGNVLSNDINPNGAHSDLRVLAAGNHSNLNDGEGLGTTIEGQYGHLTIHQDGSYAYVADKSAGLSTSQIDHFSYRVVDANGHADRYTSTSLAIHVEPPALTTPLLAAASNAPLVTDFANLNLEIWADSPSASAPAQAALSLMSTVAGFSDPLALDLAAPVTQAPMQALPEASSTPALMAADLLQADSGLDTALPPADTPALTAPQDLSPPLLTADTLSDLAGLQWHTALHRELLAESAVL